MPAQNNALASVIVNTNVQTMSTREIASLTDKEHKNVKRDTEKMLNELGEDALRYQRIYFDSMNREQTEYHLGVTLVCTLLAGYSAASRYKVIEFLLVSRDEAHTNTKSYYEEPSQLLGELFKVTFPRKISGVDTLYIMWSESMQAVKIGRTCKDPKSRVTALKTGCPDIEVVKSFPHLGKYENHLHKKFREFRVGGEWFSVTPEIAINAIEELAK